MLPVAWLDCHKLIWRKNIKTSTKLNNNRHLRTTNGSKLTLYLSFKGQRKYAARHSPFRGPTAMPCRSYPTLAQVIYICACVRCLPGRGLSRGPLACLSSRRVTWVACKELTCVNSGKILVAELPSREEKWWKVTLRWRHHRQNFARTRTNEPACRKGVTLYCKPFHYIKRL